MNGTKAKGRQIIMKLSGLAFCILPPAICTLCYFPFWRERPASLISGAVVLLIIISGIPLFKFLKKQFGSPSAPVIWFAMLVIFSIAKSICDEIIIISFAGLLGNLLGAIIFKLEKKYEG